MSEADAERCRIKLTQFRHEHRRVLTMARNHARREFGVELEDTATLMALIRGLNESPEELRESSLRILRMVVLLAGLGAVQVTIDHIERELQR